jgi:hypothetical protein
LDACNALLAVHADTAHTMKDQIVATALIFGTVALCNVASLAVVQLMQSAGVIAGVVA